MTFERNRYCSTCPRDEVAYDGDCTRNKPDGYIARCGPPWTIEKHWYVEGYCEIFSKAMPNSFPKMNFIDLFSGPGLYYHRPSGSVFRGSPLIASRYGFRKIILCDLKERNIEALKFRLKDSDRDIEFLTGDSNALAKRINSTLPPDSLSFCFADPDNMRQLRFDTLRELADKRRVDLLINFPYGNSFKRGAANAYKSNRRNTAFDLYFGTNGWRQLFSNHRLCFSPQLALEILELYLAEFYKIGYIEPDAPYDQNYVIIRNTLNREIYYLIFLSKNRLGYRFWSEAVRYIKGRNLSLSLE